MTPTEIKNEAPKVTAEQLAAKEAKAFADNINKVQDFLKDPKKTTEAQEKQLAGVLDSNFQTGLGKLECDKLENIDKNIHDRLDDKNIDLDNTEVKVLNDLHTLITPIIATSKTYEKDASKVNTTGKEKVAYNEKKGGSFLKTTIGEVDQDTYKTLPGRKEIAEALKNPTKENIVSLQDFLYKNMVQDKVDDKTLAAFKKSNQKGGKRDGMYGENTDKALNAHLQSFVKFEKQTNAELLDNRSRADKLAQSNDKLNKETEEKADKQAEVDLVNSKITYEHPERADKAIKENVDKKKSVTTYTYRGEKLSTPILPTLAFLPNKGGSVGKSNTMNPKEEVDFKETDAFKKFIENTDKQLDAKIMTYDAKTDHYNYGGKYISRDKIGNGLGQMTLEQFQTEVNHMNMSKTNEFRTKTKEVSLDGKTTKTTTDFELGKGGKTKINTLNDEGELVSESIKKVRGDRIVTKTSQYVDGEQTSIKTISKNGTEKRTERDGDGLITLDSKENQKSFKAEGTQQKNLVLDANVSEANTVNVSNKDIVDALNKSIITKKVNYQNNDLEGVEPGILGISKNTSEVTETETNQLLLNYDIKESGLGVKKINISLKKNGVAMEQKAFDQTFEKLLKDAGVTALNREDYNIKGTKDKDSKLVTDYSFFVGKGSIKKNPDLAKTIKVKEIVNTKPNSDIIITNNPMGDKKTIENTTNNTKAIDATFGTKTTVVDKKTDGKVVVDNNKGGTENKTNNTNAIDNKTDNKTVVENTTNNTKAIDNTNKENKSVIKNTTNTVKPKQEVNNTKPVNVENKTNKETFQKQFDEMTKTVGVSALGRSPYKSENSEILIAQIDGNIIKKNGNQDFSKYDKNTGNWSKLNMMQADGLYQKVEKFENRFIIKPNNSAKNNGVDNNQTVFRQG